MVAPTDYISEAEYLERERLAEMRSEYVEGRIYAMAGASRLRYPAGINHISRLLGRASTQKSGRVAPRASPQPSHL